MARVGSNAKHEQIKSALRSYIIDGTYAVGDQIPSQNELIRGYGVSYSTVMHALQDLVREGYLIRVQGKGTFVSKPPDRAEGRRPRLLGVTLPYVGPGDGPGGGVYDSRTLSAMESAAREHGFQLIVTCSESDPAIERSNIEELYNHGVAGLALWHVGGEANVDWLERFRREGIPFVLFDRYLPYYPTDYVVTDNRLVGLEATRALIKTGFSRVAVFATNEVVSSVTERIEGYTKALVEAGSPVDESMIQLADWRDAPDAALRLARRFFRREKGPVAVFAINTAFFLAVWQAIGECGRDQDGSVALATVGNPWVTVPDAIPFVMVDQPLQEMGRSTIELLVKKIAGDQSTSKVVLPPNVYVRIKGRVTLNGKPVEQPELIPV